MARRDTLEGVTVVAIVLGIAAFAALFVLFQDITISSDDVDDILYKRLDEYNRAIRENSSLASIITTAESDPANLTEDERQMYLTYQRAFFDGWEAAFIHNDSGAFDADRWNIWNTWYIEEVQRRPRFGWTENRSFYTGGFLHHVDESLAMQTINRPPVTPASD